MEKPKVQEKRLEVWIAILIALVSLTAALAAWRTASLGSKAGDLIYQGALEAVKRQAAANIHWRQAYEEAGYARDYLITLDGLNVQENSSDPASRELAAQLRSNFLPEMETMATPLGTDPAFITSEGTLNVQMRFNELEAQSDLSSLDPLASFSLADTYYAEQRLLVLGTILIAVSLFWLGMFQLSNLRTRTPILVLGVSVYGIGVVWSLGIEVVFLFLRGGLL